MGVAKGSRSSGITNRGSSITNRGSSITHRGSSISWGSSIGSSIGSNWSSSNKGGLDRLNMDVRLSRNLDINIGLGGDLLVDVGLSSILLVDVRLSSILLVDVRLSWDLGIKVGLGGDLLVNVGLSGWGEVGIGHRGVISSSIQTTSNSNRSGSVTSGYRASWESSISGSIGIASGGIRVARVASNTSRVREGILGSSDSQAGKGGDKRLHCDG